MHARALLVWCPGHTRVLREPHKAGMANAGCACGPPKAIACLQIFLCRALQVSFALPPRLKGRPKVELEDYWQKSKRLETGSLLVLWLEDPSDGASATATAGAAAAAHGPAAPGQQGEQVPRSGRAAGSAAAAAMGAPNVELVVCVVVMRSQQARLDALACERPSINLK